jgi:putative flippase GtrA
VLSGRAMGIRQSLESLYRRLLEAWQDRAIVLKALSFATIGVINATIDFSVFTFAHYYLGWRIVIANIVAWMIAVTNSYVMNSLITFAAESGRRLRVKDYVMFAASQAGGLLANTATVFVLSFFVEAWLAKIPAIGASFLVDFSLSHFVVFRRRESPPRP